MKDQLVPVDELHWDDSTKSFNVLSRDQTEQVVEACLRIGMNKKDDVLKVVKEYETVMAGVLLFKEFLGGRVGVYEFSDAGEPIFEPVRDNKVTEVEFVSFDDDDAAAGCQDTRECEGRPVACDSEAEWDVLSLYGAVLDFCARWGVDVLAGESPDESSRAVDDPEFLSALRRRSWSVTGVERGRDRTTIRVGLFGKWLRTRH